MRHSRSVLTASAAAVKAGTVNITRAGEATSGGGLKAWHSRDILKTISRYAEIQKEHI